jgi:outer membrane protein TolC
VQQTPFAAVHRRKSVRNARLEHLLSGRRSGHAKFLRAESFEVAGIKADQVVLALIETQDLHRNRLKRAEQFAIVLRQQWHIRAAQFHVDLARLKTLGIARAITSGDAIFEAHASKLVQGGEESGNFLCSFLHISNRHNEPVSQKKAGRGAKSGKWLETQVKLRFLPYAELVRTPEEIACFARSVVAIALALQFPAAEQLSAHAQATNSPVAKDSSPIVITFEEAVRRAQANEPNFAAAAANNGVAALDRSIARAGMLPSVVYHNQYLYTQANGLSNQAGQGAASQPAPKFIANNAVREYASQAMVNESLGLDHVAGVKRADAATAQAAAELEISRRGLVSAVTNLFYGLAAADNRLAAAQRALTEAQDFTKLTTEREQAREAAHADVLKAQLVEQQRARDFSDATLAAEKARLELAVVLFSDPRTPYTLALPESASTLASRTDVEQAAAKNNPELKSALAALNVSNADVLAARAAYLPDLQLNVTYGIDAPQFAVNGPDGVRNLGYSASATLDIPVWDWLSTQHKVKQTEIRRDAVKVALTATQKHLIALLDEAYDEAAAAREQLASLDASVTTAAESMRLTRMRYQSGEATVLEVVDAQNAFLTTENAREDGRVRYQTALAQLQSLTGTM